MYKIWWSAKRNSSLINLMLLFDAIRDLEPLVSASIFVIDIFTWLLEEFMSNAHTRFNIWTKKLRSYLRREQNINLVMQKMVICLPWCSLARTITISPNELVLDEQKTEQRLLAIKRAYAHMYEIEIVGMVHSIKKDLDCTAHRSKWNLLVGIFSEGRVSRNLAWLFFWETMSDSLGSHFSSRNSTCITV
jgi:hypothetical protein